MKNLSSNKGHRDLILSNLELLNAKKKKGNAPKSMREIIKFIQTIFQPVFIPPRFAYASVNRKLLSLNRDRMFATQFLARVASSAPACSTRVSAILSGVSCNMFPLPRPAGAPIPAKLSPASLCRLGGSVACHKNKSVEISKAQGRSNLDINPDVPESRQMGPNGAYIRRRLARLHKPPPSLPLSRRAKRASAPFAP